MELVSAALILFFVMDPLGNIPVFTTVLSKVAPERRRLVLTRELLIALAFLLAFFLGGRILLDALGLEQDAIRIGGGILLFLIALRLIFPPEAGMFGDTLDGEPLVFPLAVPLVAGPSSFATVLLLLETPGSSRVGILAAIVAAWGACAVLLAASPLILRALGHRGLLATERLMGMLLTMLSVQMVMEGIEGFLGP
ncbi:MAG: MarC family protein [Gemmatimonadetes bacterium]|nr:MarC family protein [Gemmatimonadota bacterium]